MVRLRRKLVSKMKSLRAQSGDTQEKLAEIIGVSRQTISYLEKGEYNPSLKIAHDIARHFGQSIDEIFTFEPVLKIKREEFNLTQDQLAILLGISVEEVNKLENDEYEDPPKFADKLAKQLNCTLEELFED